MDNTNYIGWDFHQRYSQLVIKNKDGKLVDRFKIQHFPEVFEDPDVVKLFSQPTKIAIEACNGWYWIVDELEKIGCEVHLAHPLKTKLIAEAKVKTDKIDANVLADLLRTNFLPESYLAPVQIREEREIHRHRAALVKIKTSVKNRIHSILSKFGIFFMDISDIFGEKGRRELNKIVPKLKPVYGEELKRYLSLLDYLEKEIEQIERQINSIAKKDELIELLMTIPGIGEYSAFLIKCEIGDINRFLNPKKLIRYAGLNPGADISGKHSYSKRITKQGNKWLRWILIQDAPHAVKSDRRFQTIYKRIAIRKGKNTAKVAVAREMLFSIYWVLKKREPYCPKSVTPFFNMSS